MTNNMFQLSPNDQMTHICKIYSSHNIIFLSNTMYYCKIILQCCMILHTHTLRYLHTDILAYLNTNIRVQYSTVK